jgi:surface polysaccharide O-acyltransferase-like enzyme
VVFRGLNFNGFVYNLFISGKPFYHLWYFYMLLGLTALTPLLSSLRESYGNKLMAWMSIVALTLFVIVPPFSEFTPLVRVESVPPYLVWFMPYLGYYCLGSYLANTEIRIRSSVLWLVVMMSLTITVWGVYAFGRSFHSYLALNTILLSVSLFWLFKRITLASAHASRLQRLAGTTLGIYLIHPLILEIIDMTGISVKSIDATFAIPLITIVGWVASYVLTLLLLRSRYLKLMVQ